MAKTWVLVEQEQVFCDVCGRRCDTDNGRCNIDGKDLCLVTRVNGLKCEERLKLFKMIDSADIAFCGTGNEILNKHPVRIG